MRTPTLAVLLALAVAGTVQAAPTVDAEKPADSPLAWQTTTKFSTLHADLGAATVSKWHDYGSYDEAQRILSDALRYSGSLYSDQSKYDHFMQACRDAKRYCGRAQRYERMIDVLMRSADRAGSYRDSATALQGGCEFLVRGGGGSHVTQDILNLGLAETRGSMSSFENAYKILFDVVTEAQRDAQHEDQQWYSVLNFTKTGADQTGSWRNGYRVLERICYTVATTPYGQTVFLRSLAAIANAGLDNAQDSYKVIVAGLRQYGRDVPSETHKALADFLVACADRIDSWQSANTLLVAAVDKMQGLDMHVSAKVLLRAGRDLSNVNLSSDQHRYIVAVEALRRTSRMNVPEWVRRECERGVRHADAASSYREGLRIAQDAIEYALREGGPTPPPYNPPYNPPSPPPSW